ncbi:gp533 [Bacillus phage G]|uniref:Gp533 n=1 Tax=Bacillus phage G TaxID=2884420 RepID=G3MAS4_9CAUD|nr:gp533 [Bacillus phage G]AEO93791.1 gp533 [Bacillus phage G]
MDEFKKMEKQVLDKIGDIRTKMQNLLDDADLVKNRSTHEALMKKHDELLVELEKWEKVYESFE